MKSFALAAAAMLLLAGSAFAQCTVPNCVECLNEPDDITCTACSGFWTPSTDGYSCVCNEAAGWFDDNNGGCQCPDSDQFKFVDPEVSEGRVVGKKKERQTMLLGRGAGSRCAAAVVVCQDCMRGGAR